MVDKWIWGLSRRERRLLPYLLQGAERKGSQLLWPFISRQLMDWRSFYILVDVLFRTDREEQVPILWMWLRRSYQYSWEQIERRMKFQQIRLWRRWLETPTQPACCLADMALEEERYYLDVLHDVGLTEKHPFFQQVWQETLRLATKEFFLQQEELFGWSLKMPLHLSGNRGKVVHPQECDRLGSFIGKAYLRQNANIPYEAADVDTQVSKGSTSFMSGSFDGKKKSSPTFTIFFMKGFGIGESLFTACGM